jgi:hypothetical protein
MKIIVCSAYAMHIRQKNMMSIPSILFYNNEIEDLSPEGMTRPHAPYMFLT